MKKIIALVAVLSLLAINCATFAPTVREERAKRFAQKQGAQLIVHKKDGQRIKGELIAVKESSLLMLTSGADVSVDIRDIRIITIVRKSWTTLGMLGGMIVGGLLGNLIEKGNNGLGAPGGLGYLFGLPLGAFIGAGMGAALGADKTIAIYDKTQDEVEKVLEKLRQKARIPDYK